MDPQKLAEEVNQELARIREEKLAKSRARLEKKRAEVRGRCPRAP